MNNELEIFKTSLFEARRAVLKSQKVVVSDRKNVQTKADMDAQDAIISTLKKNNISCEIFSEELETPIILGEGKYKVILDPLDGSFLFLRGIPYFASIAMIVMEENEVKYAFSLSIADEKLYYCDSSKAYLNDEVIICRSNQIDKPYLIAGYASRKYLFDQIPKMGKLADIYFLNYAGSLLSAMVGSNNVDAVIEFIPTSFHEFAGAIIAERAGASVQTIQGGPLLLDPLIKQTVIVARSKELLNELQAVLK